MNIHYYQGALAFTNDPLITSSASLFFLNFNKIGHYYIQYLFPIFVVKYKKTRGKYEAIGRSLAIANDPRLLLMFNRIQKYFDLEQGAAKIQPLFGLSIFFFQKIYF